MATLTPSQRASHDDAAKWQSQLSPSKSRALPLAPQTTNTRQPRAWDRKPAEPYDKSRKGKKIMKRHDVKPLQELQQAKARGDGCWVASTPEKTANEAAGVGKRRLLGDMVGPITVKWTESRNQDFQVPLIQDASDDIELASSKEISRKRTADGAFVVRQDSVPRETPELEPNPASSEPTAQGETEDDVELRGTPKSSTDHATENENDPQVTEQDETHEEIEIALTETCQSRETLEVDEQCINIQAVSLSTQAALNLLEKDEEDLDESDSEGSLEDFEEQDEDNSAELGQDFCTDSVLEPSQLEEDDEEQTTSFQEPTITLSLPRPEATTAHQSPVRALLQREAVAAMNLRAISFSSEQASPIPEGENEDEPQAKADPEQPQDDEETAHLLSFLHRVRSSRAARLANAEATTFLRASLSPAQDNTILSPLSPNVDASSPSKVTAEQATPTKAAQREQESSSTNEIGATRRSKRARTPSKTSNPPPGPPTSHIPLHRRADGADTIIFPKSAVQELAVITRTNTRRNRGDRNVTAQTIRNLGRDEEATTAVKPSKSRRQKSVVWDETLVYFQTLDEEVPVKALPEKKIKERPKKVPRTRTPAKPKEKKPTATPDDQDSIMAPEEGAKEEKPTAKKSIPRAPRALPKPKVVAGSGEESALPRSRASPRAAAKSPPKSRLPSISTRAGGVAKSGGKTTRATAASGPKRRGSSRA